MRRTFKEFSDAATGIGRRPPEMSPLVTERPAPSQVIAKVFDYQSYFDTAFQETALLEQPQNQLIVPSTKETVQSAGYGVALAPWSETPVAISFLIGGQPSSSTVYVLKPGESIRPFGRPSTEVPTSFSGFVWGLPFGWLGGGLAHLTVMTTHDADIVYPENRREVIFQRQRLVIRSLTDSALSYRANWPLAFPWIEARRGVTGGTVPQSSQPSFQVLPTRIVGRLNVSSLSAPETVFAIFARNEAFDASPVAASLLFQSFAQTTVTDPEGAAYNAPRPVAIFPETTHKLGGPDASLGLFVAPDSELVGATMDVVRWGML